LPFLFLKLASAIGIEGGKLVMIKPLNPFGELKDLRIQTATCSIPLVANIKQYL
jgi:hypothetical protein